MSHVVEVGWIGYHFGSQFRVSEHLSPLLQPLFLWNLEDEAPFAPRPQHLLLAVVRGVGHIEDGA